MVTGDIVWQILLIKIYQDGMYLGYGGHVWNTDDEDYLIGMCPIIKWYALTFNYDISSWDVMEMRFYDNCGIFQM